MLAQRQWRQSELARAPLFLGRAKTRGVILPYISHLGMRRSKAVGLMYLFGLKKGRDTYLFFVWNRVRVLRELRTCLNAFIVSIPKEYERKRYMRIKKSFSDAVLKGRVWKRVWKMTFFKTGSGFGQSSGTPPPLIPRSSPGAKMSTFLLGGWLSFLIQLAHINRALKQAGQYCRQ